MRPWWLRRTAVFVLQGGPCDGLTLRLPRKAVASAVAGEPVIAEAWSDARPGRYGYALDPSTGVGTYLGEKIG